MGWACTDPRLVWLTWSESNIFEQLSGTPLQGGSLHSSTNLHIHLTIGYSKELLQTLCSGEGKWCHMML